MKRTVGIFIFDDAEVLDFAGPFEVFAVASEVHNHELFEVFTVGKTSKSISAVNGLSVNPTYDFNNHPKIDILILAGGDGTKKVMGDTTVLNWITKVHQTTLLTASICSGSRFLGKLGLLDNKPFCTHHQVYSYMKDISPTAIPKKNLRFVKSDDRVYTSSGISAGIDLSFHILNELHGEATTEATARYMEYDVKLL